MYEKVVFLARKVNFRWKSWLSWKRITSITSTSIRCILRRFEDRFSRKTEFYRWHAQNSPGKRLEVRFCVGILLKLLYPQVFPLRKKNCNSILLTFQKSTDLPSVEKGLRSYCGDCRKVFFYPKQMPSPSRNKE